MTDPRSRCTRVERWIFGYYTVKYSDSPDPVRKPLLGMRHCPNKVRGNRPARRLHVSLVRGPYPWLT